MSPHKPVVLNHLGFEEIDESLRAEQSKDIDVGHQETDPGESLRNDLKRQRFGFRGSVILGIVGDVAEPKEQSYDNGEFGQVDQHLGMPLFEAPMMPSRWGGRFG
jgi:hypothetical protein